MSEKFLCVPCRIAREGQGKTLEKTRHSRDKGTCAICKRRRFGDYYIEKRAKPWAKLKTSTNKQKSGSTKS